MSFTTEPWATDPWTTNPWATYIWGDSVTAFTANPTGVETLQINTSLPAGETVTIDWGDGASTEVVGPVSEQSYNHEYAGAGAFPITFSGDYQALTRIRVYTVSISGTLGDLAKLSGVTYLAFYDDNTLSGDIADIGENVTTLGCYGDNTISGDIADFSTNFTNINCRGSNTITGDIANLTNLTIFYFRGDNTITGDIANLPSEMVTVYCYGANTLYGDLADLPSGVTNFTCFGLNTVFDYSGKTWTTKPGTFAIAPTGTGGLSSAEVDQLLIDFDDDLAWSSGDIITLTGTNEARTSASDTAVTNMTNEGATITTN